MSFQFKNLPSPTGLFCSSSVSVLKKDYQIKSYWFIIDCPESNTLPSSWGQGLLQSTNMAVWTLAFARAISKESSTGIQKWVWPISVTKYDMKSQDWEPNFSLDNFSTGNQIPELGRRLTFAQHPLKFKKIGAMVNNCCHNYSTSADL